MAFAKIQKQLNIANQLITEKVFNGEKSKFNDDFTEMEKKTDATADLIEELQHRTKEFLQPNPAARAKMAALKLSSSGQAKSQYPQTEGNLGNAMINHGKKLGEDSCLGQALTEAGDSLKQVADVKYSLDNNVKQNFLDPLNHLQNNDLKEVMHHRKKLSNRRLDFDGKRRKMGRGTTEDEVRIAQEKFKESLHNASTSMYHLLENDVELISQLCVFSESLMQYYQSCADIMQDLTSKLYEKKSEAMNRPKKDFIPTSLSDLNIDSISLGSNSDRHNNNSNVKPTISNPIPMNSSQQNSTVHLINNFNNNYRNQSSAFPHCVALYDFEAENPGELSFKENDTIRLINKVDENWFEGMINGQTGYFPQSYVQVKIPLS